MQLEITQISFLNNGQIAVEVAGENPLEAPDLPSLDVVRFRIFMNFNPDDTLAQVRGMALRVAQASLGIGET
jgi:hypothetical protein